MKKLILCSLLFFSSLFSSQIYKYEEQTGNKKSYLTWTLEETDKSIDIVGEEEEGTTTINLTKNFVINKYAFKSKIEPTDYEFSFDGNTLTAKGKVNNLSISKEHPIQTNWIQQFSFGLRSFVLSKQKSINFCLITPDDFSLQYMVAKKEGHEYVSSNGKKYQTLKVILTLPGIKGMFWKARLWFDVSSGILVKYSANKGPNTPTTVIMLQSIEEKKKDFWTRPKILRKKSRKKKTGITSYPFHPFHPCRPCPFRPCRPYPFVEN